MAWKEGASFLRSVMRLLPPKLGLQQVASRMVPAVAYSARHASLARGATGTVSGLFVVNALTFGFGNKPIDASQAKESKEKRLIREADRLYEEHKIEELHSMLVEYVDSNDAEILWRLARAMCEKGKVESDDKAKEAYYRDALKHAAKALCMDENNYACHKWYAFMLNYLTPFVGTKESLKNAFVIKTHLYKAMELNSKDATAVHALGYWCYTFADLKWYEKRLASILFVAPPTSTFKEALDYFLKAEDIEPEFYSMNLLMIGKTYVKLQNVKMAYLYLSKAGTYPVKTEDDRVAQREATQLMKELLDKQK